MGTGSPPRVSVGIPVYNGMPWLEEAITSVLSQTYADLELIISDNASTDRTEEICRRYADADPRVRYHRNERNLGAARNFNRVFELASGELFKWQAADNAIYPQFLERCVRALDEHREAVLAFTRCEQRNEFEDTLRVIDVRHEMSSPRVYERFVNLFAGVLGMFDPIWGLVRSDVLRATHRIRPFIGSDACLLMELALAGPWIEVPEHLLLLRIHPGGLHAQGRKGEWWKPDASKERARPGPELARWWDADSRGRVFFPSWRRLREYAAIILHSDHGWSDRARMLGRIGRLAVHWRGYLAQEAWDGITHVARRPALASRAPREGAGHR